MWLLLCCVALHRPFNMEPELMDASMFNYSLSLGITLAKRFGVPQPRMMSQR